ncbi:PQ-loop domain-containing transporter [Crocinitomix sp.]|nr:PQ-loop domain-containing transporter [Crocinitomix sp.]
MPNNLNPDSFDFARTYPSTEGISAIAMLIIFVGFILFTLYIIIRVRKSLKDDERA